MSDSLQEIVCCLGQPVAGNPTQFMMERAFAAAGLDWRYLTLEVPPQRLADALRGMRAMGFRGANLTIPHKVAVIELLDGLSEAAKLMQAVNCIRHIDDKLLGDNTDGKGFVQSLKTVVDPRGKRVVVLGAGGAARAIAVETALAGAAEIAIVNRTPSRGQELVDLLVNKVNAAARLIAWEGDYRVDPAADILVNATSLGMGNQRDRVPVAIESLRAELVVADVIFNPPQTRLLLDAAQRGCKTLDGLGMLVNQAAIAFHLWTQVQPDAAIMREALEEFLGL